MDLLRAADETNTHYVCVKDFNRFICTEIKIKNKKHFCRYCLKRFRSEIVLINIKNFV